MRASLDLLYRTCGVLGAICLAAIGVLILAQIIGRFFGVLVPSANELAGMFMAASTFLALAYAFRAGAHIRVELVLQRFPPKLRRGFDLGCLALAAVLVGYFTWYTVWLAVDSHRYGEVATGLVPIPLWIPQAAMTLGLGVLAIAMIDEFLHVLRGGVPSYDEASDVVTGLSASEPD